MEQPIYRSERHVNVDEVVPLQAWPSGVTLHPFLIVIVSICEVLRYISLPLSYYNQKVLSHLYDMSGLYKYLVILTLRCPTYPGSIVLHCPSCCYLDYVENIFGLDTTFFSSLSFSCFNFSISEWFNANFFSSTNTIFPPSTI